MLTIRTTLAALLAAGVVSTTASAAVTYPGPYVGADVTYTDITEASADPVGDPEPLYGAPTGITGNNLDFDPVASAFSADAPPPDSTDGSLMFLVTSNSGATIDTLIVSESGDYTFSGSPAAGEAVAATLLVQVLDPVTEAVLISDTTSFFEVYDSAPLETGDWSHSLTFDLSGFGMTEYKVLVDNLLQASGNGQATSLIRKKDFDINVPEPATGALALAGLALMARRRQG